MKKRIFSRALALVMAVSLLSTTAFAAVLNQEYVNDSNHWTSDQYGNYVVLGADTYTVEGSISTDRILQVNGTTTQIDLNGNTITHTGEKGSVVLVTGGGNLTIKDSKGPDADGNYSGTITGGKGIKGFTNPWDNYGGGIYVNGKSTLTLESGNISGNTPGYGGGGVHVSDGSAFVMNGGSISDNSTNYSGAGGVSVVGKSTFTMNGGKIDKNISRRSAGAGVYVDNGSTVNMYDGAITNNKSQYGGGGVYIKNGTFTMTDGIISKNESLTKNGGGIYVETSGAQFIMNGGEISENTAAVKGGGIYGGDNATITGGKIINNKAKEHNGIDGNPAPSPSALICNGDTSGITQHDETVVREIPATYDAPGLRSYYCSNCNELIRTEEIAQLTRPVEDNNNDIALTPDGSGATVADTTTIEDEETPLAGIVTLADLLNALWEYEGIEEVELPEDFKWLDHDYAQAIYWGLDEALVVDTEDDPLDPNELLTVGLMREVLVNFVELYHGLEDFEVVLEGEDEDLVMDLGERLTAFYGELEAALEAQAA